MIPIHDPRCVHLNPGDPVRSIPPSSVYQVLRPTHAAPPRSLSPHGACAWAIQTWEARCEPSEPVNIVNWSKTRVRAFQVDRAYVDRTLTKEVYEPPVWLDIDF